MKKTPFKRKLTKPMKRTPLKKESPNKVTKRKTSIYKWVAPSWIKSIPQGSHGSTSIQKKLWKVVSDFVRIKDFYLNGTTCPGCLQNKFGTWKDGQAGHWKSWGASNSYAKYELRNLLMICSNCNRNEDGMIGYRIGEKLKQIYGNDNPVYIDSINNENRGRKLDDIILVDILKMIILSMSKLPEQPDYYKKVVDKL